MSIIFTSFTTCGLVLLIVFSLAFVIFALLIVLVPCSLNALLICESAEVDVHSEALIACRLHLHTSQADEVTQSALLCVARIEVPSKDFVISLVENLGYASAVLLRHYLVVRVDVSYVFAVVVHVTLIRLGSITHSEIH